MSPIELTAAAFGLAAVALTTRQSVWCWPAGLVQVTLYVSVFYTEKLYSDAVLHVIYIALQLYGWYHWRYARPDAAPLPVTRITPAAALGWLAVGVLGTAGWGYLMTQAGADYPYPDAGIAAFSLIAQYLMTRKVLEHWPVWMAVDVVGVWVYAAKGLYATAALYVVFFALCVYGLIAWTRDYRRGRPPG